MMRAEHAELPDFDALNVSKPHACVEPPSFLEAAEGSDSI